MAVVKTYRPNTVRVTATSTIDNNGKAVTAATDKLSNWQRIVVFGKIRATGGGAITDAGIRIFSLPTANATLTSGRLIATVFTDIYGEYGISLKVLASPNSYGFEAYSPGNH